MPSVNFGLSLDDLRNWEANWIALAEKDGTVPTDPKLKTTLELIFSNDIAFTVERDAHYESSWKRRGGAGAFFTIARPWDRFEAIAKRGNFDLFQIIREEQDKGLTESNDGTLQACIRDLRIYMALLAAEALNSRSIPLKSHLWASVSNKTGDCYLSPKEEAARG